MSLKAASDFFLADDVQMTQPTDTPVVYREPASDQKKNKDYRKYECGQCERAIYEYPDKGLWLWNLHLGDVNRIYYTHWCKKPKYLCAACAKPTQKKKHDRAPMCGW